MRRKTICIDGEEHLLCYSVNAMLAVQEHFADGDLGAALFDGSVVENFENALWMISVLMRAGAEYAALRGLENKKPLSEEELRVLVGPDDLGELIGAIADTISAGSKRNIELESSKNQTATR